MFFKTHRHMTFSKFEAGLNYHLVVGPILWRMPTFVPCPTPKKNTNGHYKRTSYEMESKRK
jgi:hypothetical protein